MPEIERTPFIPRDPVHGPHHARLSGECESGVRGGHLPTGRPAAGQWTSGLSFPRDPYMGAFGFWEMNHFLGGGQWEGLPPLPSALPQDRGHPGGQVTPQEDIPPQLQMQGRLWFKWGREGVGERHPGSQLRPDILTGRSSGLR